MAERITAACRRRLADSPRERWLWALGSGLFGTGIPWLMAAGLGVVAWHANSRRTLTPALYGLTLFGGFAFALATIGAVLMPMTIAPAGLAVFAFGHHQGQQKAARDGRRWLDLDR